MLPEKEEIDKINSIKRSLSLSLFFDEKIDSILTFWGGV
jgi:hypothetical protein